MLALVNDASDEARKLHSAIREAVRECLHTYRLQAAGGPVTTDALDQILHRSAALILKQFEGKSSELVIAFGPILIRTMLAAFVEVIAEADKRKP